MIEYYDGVFDRLNADATFRAIFGLSGGEAVPVFPDWPDFANLTEADFPRVALTLPDERPNIAVGEALVNLDAFSAKERGLTTLGSIVDRIDALFGADGNDAVWRSNGYRYHTRVIGGGSRPESETHFHWQRRLVVMVSAA